MGDYIQEAYSYMFSPNLSRSLQVLRKQANGLDNINKMPSQVKKLLRVYENYEIGDGDKDNKLNTEEAVIK